MISRSPGSAAKRCLEGRRRISKGGQARGPRAHEKGWILVERGAFTDAELAFNDSLRSMPRGASAKLGLFAVAASQGNRERAETLRNELRQLHPDPARLKIWSDRYLAKGGSAE